MLVGDHAHAHTSVGFCGRMTHQPHHSASQGQTLCLPQTPCLWALEASHTTCEVWQALLPCPECPHWARRQPHASTGADNRALPHRRMLRQKPGQLLPCCIQLPPNSKDSFPSQIFLIMELRTLHLPAGRSAPELYPPATSTF